MITQYEVYSLLTTEIPLLAAKAYPSRASLQMYASINYFTDYTKRAVEEHNYNRAKKCFAVAESLYLHGDSMVHLLIENSLIYSLSSFRSMSQTEQCIVKSIIPERLFAVYIKNARQHES
jgi:hypothetical protein